MKSRFSSIVILITLCGFVLCSCTPQPQEEHTARVRFYVNNSHLPSISVSSEDLDTAESLADIYAVVLKSRTVCDDILAESGCDYTYEELRSMLSLEAIDGTEMFEVAVTSSHKEDSERIARAVTAVLPAAIESIAGNCSVSIVDTLQSDTP